MNNRRLRHKFDDHLRKHSWAEAGVLPVTKEVSDPWGMTKDEKIKIVSK